jgi:alkylmercury lyase
LRINGTDVDPTASERTDFGLKCRLYPSAEGLRGRIPDELVLAALTRAQESRDAGRPAVEVSPAGVDALALARHDTFPSREDSPLALGLVRLHSAGSPVSLAALGQVVDRPVREVTERLDDGPNIERDHGRLVGFSGLALRTTAHSVRVGDRELYAWCAWDAQFLPALLDETAQVRSKCAVTGVDVGLVVSPRGVHSTSPRELHLTFPALAGLDTGDIRRSFCCHVVFLAGAEAARRWEATHAGGMALDVDAAYALGHRTVAPLLEPASRLVPEFGR